MYVYVWLALLSSAAVGAPQTESIVCFLIYYSYLQYFTLICRTFCCHLVKRLGLAWPAKNGVMR